MTAKGIFYVFALVSDFARSKRFYGEMLGWTLGTDQQDVAGFSVGTGYLVIHADDRPRDARPYAGGMHVAVQVENVEAEHARLRERGVAVSELRDQPWGERNFYFEDRTDTRGRTARRDASTAQRAITSPPRRSPAAAPARQRTTAASADIDATTRSTSAPSGRSTTSGGTSARTAS
jgi:catechol 2,3-dioxygenase-like lactoylglutathione lyase family enzyme